MLNHPESPGLEDRVAMGLDRLQSALAETEFVRGLADARTVVLDLEALLVDARFGLPGA